MKIELNKGFFVEIDDSDYELISKHKWFASKIGNNIYAVSDERNKNGKYIYMHRLIMGFEHKLIDHINKNGLDNRRINLRSADKSINLLNSRKTYKNKTGYRGVKKYFNRYVARIVKHGKDIHLGTFETAELAAKRFNEEAIKLHGENAKLNTL